MSRVVLKFRAVNKDTFETIKDGRKKIETRAGTKKYLGIKKGDIAVFVCGKKRFEKRVKKIEHFSSIAAILKKYKPVQINPKTHTIKEAREMWYSFPGYKEKIKKGGLLAITI